MIAKLVRCEHSQIISDLEEAFEVLQLSLAHPPLYGLKMSIFTRISKPWSDIIVHREKL